jgi:hypothetical protein
MAHALARKMGGKEYLTAKAKMVADNLMSRDTIPPHVTVRENGALQTYRIARIYPRPTHRRAVDKAVLKRMYPSAYQAAVTVSAPDRPYQLRLDPEFPGKKSQEWSTERSLGADNWAAVLEQRYGALEWNRLDTQTRVLYELRRDARAQDARIEAARAELILFVTDNQLPLVVRGLGDGRLVLRENPPLVRVDYDVLETQFPAAASLIKRFTTPGTPQIRFLKPKSEDDEEDDSDDSASGIWKA